MASSRLERARAAAAAFFEMPGGRNRAPALDGIRGFGALLVFLVHTHILFQPYLNAGSVSFAVSHFLFVIGHSGVDFFFLLSGYLIHEILMRQRGSYGNYFYRRLLRIFPPFLAVLALYMALDLGGLSPEARIPRGWGEAITYVLQNLLLLPGMTQIEPLITVAWSLSYELFYYLCLPMLFVLLRLRRWTPAGRAVLVVVLSAGYLLWRGTDPYLSGSLLGVSFEITNHPRLVLFAAGILLREIHAGGAGPWVLAAARRAAPVVFVLGLVALYVVYLFDEYLQVAVWNVLVEAFAFSPLFLCCLSGTGRLARAFAAPPLRWLGHMSYSFYLCHSFMLHAVLAGAAWVLPAPQPEYVYWIVLVPGGFLAAAVVSGLLFLAVEKPCLRAIAASR